MQDKFCLSRAAGLVQAYSYGSFEDHTMQDVMVHVSFARHTTQGLMQGAAQQRMNVKLGCTFCRLNGSGSSTGL